MIDIKLIILSFTFGVVAVTVIDVLGSITSRKWKYNYALLSPLSFLVYAIIGYYTTRISALNWALITACGVGIYDGTVGWKLAIVFDANFGKFKEQNSRNNVTQRIIFMIFFSGIFGFIGFLIARFRSQA